LCFVGCLWVWCGVFARCFGVCELGGMCVVGGCVRRVEDRVAQSV